MRATIWCGLLILFQATISAAQQLVIKDQRELRVEQGNSITIGLGDITVEADRGLDYPNGFYLEIDDKGNYDVAGSTITPSAGFNGTLKVKIRVTNGKVKSDKFQLRIEVIKAGRGSGNGDDDDDDNGDDDDDNDDGNDDDNDGGDDDDDDNDNGGANDTNQKPAIVSQVAVDINKNQSFTIRLSHLVVSDADNNYPHDFKLHVEAGSNYSVDGATITPGQNFVGTLTVTVRVNDGKANSDAFNFQITVKDGLPPNARPVITAQASLSIFKNEFLTVKLTDLSVTDHDNNYPADFTLTVLTGANYTVSDHTITPSAGYVGALTVKVKVHDGKDDSNLFDLRINVIERGTLQITGQNAIIIPEDSAYTLRLPDLRVSDPSDSYPEGFKLSIIDGDNYAIEGQTIRPAENFYGNLTVSVKVAKGSASSNIFEALIIVMPVNDPPAFATFDTAPITVVPVGAIAIAKEVRTSDVDHQNLAFAEAALDSANALTHLEYLSTDNVRGIFDQNKGILVFLGDAPLAEYDRALQSITYTSSDSTAQKRTIRFRVNDGEAYSGWYEKTLIMADRELTLDIPTAFTPNNDNANDTWVITLHQDHPQTELDLKVYNKQGMLLFQTDSFEQPWDGRFNGELLPADNYFFTLEVKTENREAKRKGVVAILR